MLPRPSDSLADATSFKKSRDNFLSLLADIFKKIVVTNPNGIIMTSDIK